jgi:hypothetical protein
MSKRKRSKRPNDDAIRNLQAWQDHQYDPGYRANLGRLGLFSGNRRGRPVGRFIAYALLAECALIVVFSLLTSAGVRGPIATIIFLCAVVAVLLVMLARLVRPPSGHAKRRAPHRR